MEVFQVKASIKKKVSADKRRLQKLLCKAKRRIQYRLRKKQWADQRSAMFRKQNIHYDFADKSKGLRCGGLGAFLLLVQQLGLPTAIDGKLHLLKRHVPYFESDHVLNLTYNLLVGGKTIQDLEQLRNNETYLDVLGAQRLPDPTTAGDFLRRFKAKDIEALMDAINSKRSLVWQQQPEAFFEQAIVEADGSIVETLGACKQDMDISYNNKWGYQPLLLSLANTREPLFLLNRSANRPSHEGAAAYFDRAAQLCQEAGFRKILFRGDTDFSQTAYLDAWDRAGIGFVFGMDSHATLQALAQTVPERTWRLLERPAGYQVKTQTRQRPENVKESVVRRRGYRNVRLVREDVAALCYQPCACEQEYIVVVVRKQLVWEQRNKEPEAEIRYLFYITNQSRWTNAEIVHFANDRCNQENLIQQLKNGVHALRAPVNTLESNWAYMVIGALAWTLKAWLALLLPKGDQARQLLTMEFRRFLDEVMLLPCQIVRSGGRMIFRFLQWNAWVNVLGKVSEVLRQLHWI
jgi:Transposase DDE domain group 1